MIKPDKENDNMFELVDDDEIRWMEKSFTACIIELPFDEVYGREAEIFELVASQIRGLLVDGAYVVIKVPDQVCPVAKATFKDDAFEFKTMLTHTSKGYSESWLVFQNEGDCKSPLEFKRTVFANFKPFAAETEILTSVDPENRYSPQSLLREFVKILCPEPTKADVLVPYFRYGTVIAACNAVGVKSMGYDSKKFYADENHFENVKGIIDSLTKIRK